MLIDTHAHIYLPEFESDLVNVLERARSNDIEQILLPNIDSTSLSSMNALCDAYPEIFKQMMGLHPCSVEETSYEEELELVYNELQSGKYIAVGEIGIDMYWDKTTLDEQQKAFNQQILWALEFDLPIAIHARDSFNEIFEVMKEFKGSELRGVFHCFTGTTEQAEYIAKHHPGFYFGLGGVSTFKNAGMDQVIPFLPDDKILLETDSPYLTPVPYRGKRNEPSYMLHIAQKVADLKEMSLEVLSDLTTRNARQLFSLDL